MKHHHRSGKAFEPSAYVDPHYVNRAVQLEEAEARRAEETNTVAFRRARFALRTFSWEREA